jgi:hypothetical protein
MLEDVVSEFDIQGLEAMEDRQIQENLRKIHNEIANVPGNRGAVKIVEAYGENNDN